ncbi:MAG: Gfo/Idh/MocA family oxidoreductase [Bacteroidota bacterium]
MTLKFGVIGCGRIAGRHAEHIKKHGQLVAACDTYEERAEHFGVKYDIPTYSSHKELLAKTDADLISVCTPNGLHAVHTIDALRAGKHVLCEKPMATSAKDCGEMISVALKANKQLFIVKQNRFNPPVVAVKNAINQGKLGRILSVQLNCFWNRNTAYYENSWKGSKHLDGGSLFTQFSHFIDLLYWMIGDIKNVKGFNGNYLHEGIVDFEDQGVAILEFSSGTLGTIHYTTNSHNKNMEGSMTLFGEKGSVKIGGQYLNELEYQQIEGYEIAGLPPGNPANNYGQYQGSMSNHGEVYQNVISALSGKEEIATNGFEGMKTVEIIEKIYAASKWKGLPK